MVPARGNPRVSTRFSPAVPKEANGKGSGIRRKEP